MRYLWGFMPFFSGRKLEFMMHNLAASATLQLRLMSNKHHSKGSKSRWTLAIGDTKAITFTTAPSIQRRRERMGTIGP